MLVGHCIARDTHIKSAALVANTLGIRDKIFENFNVPQRTKNILRGTGFLSSDPFGPMPESLRSSLSSINGKDNMGKAKNTDKRSQVRSPYPRLDMRRPQVPQHYNNYNNFNRPRPPIRGRQAFRKSMGFQSNSKGTQPKSSGK